MPDRGWSVGYPATPRRHPESSPQHFDDSVRNRFGVDGIDGEDMHLIIIGTNKNRIGIWLLSMSTLADV